MQLAKDTLDVGLLTDDAAMLAFFEHEVGLGPPERLRIGGDLMQHRFDAHGAVIKVNVVPELPSVRRSGYGELILAGEGWGPPRTLCGPDDVRVRIVSPGDDGIERVGVRIAVPERAATETYYRDALGWNVADGRVAIGTTRLLLEERTDAPRAVEMPVRGWTYVTVQVWSCDEETAGAVARGAALAAEARTLGEVARFSMVSDPWGNQLEISERSSLTGAPPGEGRPPTD